MSKTIAWAGVAAFLVLTFGYLLISKRSNGPSAAATPEMTSRSEPSRDPSREVAALKARLARLEGRISAEDAATSAAREREHETPAEAPPKTIPSDAESLERRTATYRAVFAGEPRDRTAATAHENAVRAYFESEAPGALEEIECRSQTCRVTLRHSGKTRDELGILWGAGPLANGSFDYMSEDGTKTYAFVGMPGHNLPILDLDGVPMALPNAGQDSKAEASSR